MTIPAAVEPTEPEPQPRPALVSGHPVGWFIPGGHRSAATGLGLAVAFATLLTMAVVAELPALMSFDRAVTSWFRSWADTLEWPVELAHAIGGWTGGFEASLTGGIVVALLLARSAWYPAAFLSFNLIVGGLATEFLKRGVGRARPPGASEWEHETLKSFPSGHATVGIYVYLAIGLVILQFARHRDVRWFARAGGWALVVFGPFLGITRLILGVHWPSDVLGGWAVGLSVLLCSALVFWVGLNLWPTATSPAHRDIRGNPADAPH